MKLYITAKDLNEADYTSMSDCPIARAFKRKKIEVEDVSPGRAWNKGKLAYSWSAYDDGNVNVANTERNNKKGFFITVEPVKQGLQNEIVHSSR